MSGARTVRDRMGEALRAMEEWPPNMLRPWNETDEHERERYRRRADVIRQALADVGLTVEARDE